MTRTRLFLIVGGVAVAGFTVGTIVVYHGRPTPGAVFLTLGWFSILATGFFLAKAASFDMRVGTAGVGLTVGRREELVREKKLLLKAIKECEFDRDTGKLDSGEAADAIRRYRARAVELLVLLDESPGKQVEDQIEKELAKRMAETGVAVGPRLCPSCAIKNDDDATFCKKCGAKLEAAK